jgi:hypothetical protein
MASTKNFKGLAIVATYLSPGVAAGAGGFIIVNGKLKKIPPRGPATRQLHAALRALAGVGKRSGR